MESKRYGGREGRGLASLLVHLKDLEEAVQDWLELHRYESAGADTKRAMREKSLLPQNLGAEQPEPYRLFLKCKKSNSLWWSGGLANQPHILMLEFKACERGEAAWADQQAHLRRLMSSGH